MERSAAPGGRVRAAPRSCDRKGGKSKGKVSAVRIFKTFNLESAHRLPNVPEGHKCGSIHGHSFRVEIHVDGPVGADTGWVMDFADLKAVFREVHDRLDHHYLNEIPGLENPTSENLARYIWSELAPDLPGLARVAIHETCTSGCVYEGD